MNINNEISFAQEMWHYINKKAKNLDNSDEHFMLSVGYILGLVSNPGPNGNKREPKMLGPFDIERLKCLFWTT